MCGTVEAEFLIDPMSFLSLNQQHQSIERYPVHSSIYCDNHHRNYRNFHTINCAQLCTVYHAEKFSVYMYACCFPNFELSHNFVKLPLAIFTLVMMFKNRSSAFTICAKLDKLKTIHKTFRSGRTMTITYGIFDENHLPATP